MNTQTQLQVIAAVLIDLKQKVERGELTDEEAEAEAKRRLAPPPLPEPLTFTVTVDGEEVYRGPSASHALDLSTSARSRGSHVRVVGEGGPPTVPRRGSRSRVDI